MITVQTTITYRQVGKKPHVTFSMKSTTGRVLSVEARDWGRNLDSHPYDLLTQQEKNLLWKIKRPFCATEGFSDKFKNRSLPKSGTWLDTDVTYEEMEMFMHIVNTINGEAK